MRVRATAAIAFAAGITFGGLPATATAQDDPWSTSAVPVSDNQVTAAVAQLDGLASRMMGQVGLPGMAVAVVYKDELIYAKGFGVRNTETGEPIDEKTVFQVASVSKSVGAAVVANAIGKGKINWTTPITKHLPWYKLDDPWVTENATVGDMYSHRSGLPGGAGDTLEIIGYGRKQVLKRLRHLPLGPFRAQYAYANFGITTGGEAAAEAAGMSWEKMSDKYLYKPLGMNSTSSTYQGFLKNKNRTSLHVPKDGEWLPLYKRDADAQSPAGGVSTNVLDMAKWMRMELAEGMFDGKRVIKRQPLLDANTAVILNRAQPNEAQRPGFYGHGMNVQTDSTGRVNLLHSGAFSQGAGTSFVMVPGLDLGIVALTNGRASGVPEALSATFVDLVETGKEQTDWLSIVVPIFEQLFANHSRLAGRTPPADPKPTGPLKQYAGTYDNDFYGSARILKKGKRLVFELGPDDMRMKLKHWNGRTFSYHLGGEMPGQKAAITFNKNLTSFTVEDLEAGVNTFQR